MLNAWFMAAVETLEKSVAKRMLRSRIRAVGRTSAVDMPGAARAAFSLSSFITHPRKARPRSESTKTQQWTEFYAAAQVSTCRATRTERKQLKERKLQEGLRNATGTLARCGAKACVTGRTVDYLEPLTERRKTIQPFLCEVLRWIPPEAARGRSCAHSKEMVSEVQNGSVVAHVPRRL